MKKKTNYRRLLKGVAGTVMMIGITNMMTGCNKDESKGKEEKPTVTQEATQEPTATPVPTKEVEKPKDDNQISFEEGEDVSYTSADADCEVIEDSGVTSGKKALKVTYKKAAWPGVYFNAPEKKTWDLKGKSLTFDACNPTGEDINLCIKLESLDAAGKAGDNTFLATIPANSTKTVNVMAAGNQDLALGMKILPSVNGGITANIGWGNGALNMSCINRFTFWINNSEKEQTLIFDNIIVGQAVSTDVESDYANLVDTYGQYTRNENPNKITSDAQFKEKAEQEEKELSAMLEETNSRNITKYFGLKDDSLRQKATGHFYTKKIKDQWFLIDPEGYPYLSTGLDILRTEDAMTWYTKREFMFQDIPAADGPLGDHYGELGGTMAPPFGISSGKGFNFYTANLELKYGENWEEAWRETAIKRFKAWGFSSIGCWADPDLFYGKGEELQFPYVAHAWINMNHTKVLKNTVSDPFDPAFKKQADLQMKELKDRGVNEDPYCMGVYVDNEIYWGDASNASERYAIIADIFGTRNAEDENAYAKRAFIDALKEKYNNDINSLNQLWGTKFTDFTGLNAPYKGKVPETDASYCMQLIADQYYRVVSESVDTYLDQILYLGSRLATFGAGDEVIQACAKYADVVSFNCYSADINQPFLQLGTFDKPVIIGEFTFTATDNNNFVPGTSGQGDNQEARGAAYTNYMKSVFSNPQLVGAHWFQYYDQPIVGRAWDGENYNDGFVDVTDQPYMDLVRAAKKINESGYEIKLSNMKEETAPEEEETVQTSKSNFPSISFEADEKAVYTLADGKDMELVPNSEQGVTDGKQSALIKIHNLSKDTSVEDFSTLSFSSEEGFSVGKGDAIYLDVVNPNDYFIQLRVNVTDVNDHTRTYYFSIQAKDIRKLSISEFGAVADYFAEDGFYGAADTGLDQSKIKNVSVYLWETMDDWAGNPDMTETQYILDHIHVDRKK